MNATMTTREEQLRDELGIPPGAQRVLVFAESSHWDPNWLLTSEQYYMRRVRPILNRVIDELEQQPRRVFALESVFFLQMFWEREQSRREALRRLLEQGRLRLTGTGITTPDTILPDPEAILRDYQLGQQWLRDQGFGIEPRLAYLPDNFGYSPATPALLRAAGFDWTTITRIDGMYFVACDYRSRDAYPAPGSSASLLLDQLKAIDFVWRAPDGSEVLCHWNAFNYFQGDQLACIGLGRWMGHTLGFGWRTRDHIFQRVQRYARELAPVSPTPYLLCPIGCDFNDPIPGLVELLDRYNHEHFPDGGVYAICAGLDDYLSLVECRRDRLPVVELDPNPYWMGFYASRPEVKIRTQRTARKLRLAGKLAVASGCGDEACKSDLDASWRLVAVSNHHDYITGTSNDFVWNVEQKPWLERAEQLADRVLERYRRDGPAAPVAPEVQPPQWRLADGRLEVVSSRYRVVMSEQVGGCLLSFRDGPDGREMLGGMSNDLVAYHDTGGLWRLGHEYQGGSFREKCRASQDFARIAAVERDGLLEVRIESCIEHRRFVRWMWFRDDSPFVRMRIQGTANRRLTLGCRFATRLRADTLDMDVPGGFLRRPVTRIYDPTYWAARSFVHLHDPQSDAGLAVLLNGPACIGQVRPGVLEWLVLRNAPRERAYGFLPLLAHPASGNDPDEHAIECAVGFTAEGDFRHNQLARQVDRVLADAWLAPGRPDIDALADSLFTTGRQDVVVTAAKPAHHGEGLVVRLHHVGAGNGHVQLGAGALQIDGARLCDARERDLGDLAIQDGQVSVPLQGAITSVRLLTRRS